MAETPTHKWNPFAAMLLLAGGLVLFALLAWSSHSSLRELEDETAMRARARMSLLQATVVLSLLKDVETGQRGFLLTRNESYLSTFRDGVAGLDPALERFREVSSGLAGVDALREELQPLVMRRVAIAARNISMFPQGEAEVTTGRNELLDEGRATMELIRSRFQSIETRLRDEIDARNRLVGVTMKRALLTSVLLTATGAFLIIAAYGLLHREQVRRLRAEGALREANARLEEAVASRTAELQQARDEIGAFALHLDRGIEAERRRLAREVHDQLGQVFTATNMLVHQALQGVPGRAQDLERIGALIGEGIATARRIASALRPPLLDDLGLGAALVHAGRQFGEQAGVQCKVEISDGERLGADQSIQLFRIVQEALTNVARHAGASRVWIEGEARGDRFRLSIEDDGRGLDPDASTSHGLISMRERALLAGGELALGTGRSGGLHVEVMLPLADKEGA